MNKLYWSGISILIFLISYYIFGVSGYTYFYDDVYAYLSYAESLYKTGIIRDLTTLPSTPPATIQNGITIIFAAFMSFFNNKRFIIYIMNFLLSINLIYIYYLVFKIGKKLNIKVRILYIFIIGLSFNYYFYGYYVAPTNDGFYASLSLLAVYLFLLFFENNNRYLGAFLLMVVLFLPFFRIQGLVVYISAIITFLLLKREYKNAFYAIVMILISCILVNCITFIYISDFSDMKKVSDMILLKNFNIAYFFSLIKEMNIVAIPSMFLNLSANHMNFYGSSFFKLSFSLLIFSFLFWLLIRSFINKDNKVFFISLIILGNFMVLLLFTVIIDRYIYLNLALILLLFLHRMPYKMQIIFVIIFFIFSIIIFGFRLYYKDFEAKIIKDNISYIEQNFQNYYLISQIPRHTYFYFNKPAITDLGIINESSELILIGNEEFLLQNETQIRNKFSNINKKILDLVWKKENEVFKTIWLSVESRK